MTTRCMVFDEVDAGIGGAVAEIVGRELRALGARGQVLCVTHLPQVAALRRTSTCGSPSSPTGEHPHHAQCAHAR